LEHNISRFSRIDGVEVEEPGEMVDDRKIKAGEKDLRILRSKDQYEGFEEYRWNDYAQDCLSVLRQADLQLH
jgi:hypothetical protein